MGIAKLEKKSYENYIKNLGYSKNTIYQYLLYYKKIKGKKFNDKLISEILLDNKGNYSIIAFLKSYCRFIDYPLNNLEKLIEKYGYKGRKPFKETKYLKKSEIDILLKEGNLRTRVIIRLMFELGLRVSEISNLTFDNFNLLKRTVEGIGKGNKEFKMYISRGLAKMLSKYFTRAKYYKLSLFPNRQNIHKRIRKHALKYLGRDDIHPHMIRHSYCMYLVNKFNNIKELQAAMRHENINSTLRYIHIKDVEKVKKKVVEIFENET